MSKSTPASPAVAFVASPDFIEALDMAAAEHGATRSHYARKILTQHLRDVGQLASDSPVTVHDAQRRGKSIVRSE